MHHSWALALLSLASLSFSSPLPTVPILRTIYQFPNTTWVENLAVRRNGNILVSLIDRPEIWQIFPSNQSAELIYHFPEATAAVGIVEVERDRFVVGVGNFSYAEGKATAGSWSAWSVEFGPGGAGHWERGGAAVKKITDIPSAIFLNGATALSTQPGIALLGDAGQGVIYRLDARTGEYSIAVDDPALKPNTSVPLQLGVNGIHYRRRDGSLYFDNTFSTPLLGRIPISPQDGRQLGPVEVIAQSAEFPLYENAAADDFALDRQGVVWLASASNSLVKITPEGEQRVIVGGVNSTVLKGCTSAAFGRTRETRDVLYITTNGGLLDPALGVEGGSVFALDTTGL